MNEYNIYCDESCYLENDHNQVMVLGGLTCPKEYAQEIFKEIRLIKHKHNIDRNFEIKWNKVSLSKVDFYLDLVNYYFRTKALRFRAIVIPDKSILDHEKHDQTHNDFYYKMYYELLKVLIESESVYNIYLDPKDTYSGLNSSNLHEYLCRGIHDWQKEVIRQVQTYSSHQVGLIQLCDLLIGAIGYHNRGLKSNPGKVKIVKRIQLLSRRSLKRTTAKREEKMNLLIWKSSDTL